MGYYTGWDHSRSLDKSVQELSDVEREAVGELLERAMVEAGTERR